MFNVQPDNHHLRLNITTDKKYRLRPEENGFLVQNPLFHISYKTTFYTFFIIRYDPNIGMNMVNNGCSYSGHRTLKLILSLDAINKTN